MEWQSCTLQLLLYASFCLMVKHQNRKITVNFVNSTILYISCPFWCTSHRTFPLSGLYRYFTFHTISPTKQSGSCIPCYCIVFFGAPSKKCAKAEKSLYSQWKGLHCTIMFLSEYSLRSLFKSYCTYAYRLYRFLFCSGSLYFLWKLFSCWEN